MYVNFKFLTYTWNANKIFLDLSFYKQPPNLKFDKQHFLILAISNIHTFRYKLPYFRVGISLLPYRGLDSTTVGFPMCGGSPRTHETPRM